MQQITFLQADDLDETHAFYADGLGLEWTLDQGACRIYRVGREAFVGFCDHREGPSPEGVIVTLVADDVDAFCERIESAGFELESEPSYNEKFRIYRIANSLDRCFQISPRSPVAPSRCRSARLRRRNAAAVSSSAAGPIELSRGDSSGALVANCLLPGSRPAGTVSSHFTIRRP